MDWEKFEKDCCDYLNENFGNDNISFKLEGSHDSTKSDIKCYIDDKLKFFIEVKKNKAQSGQFVILKDKNDKKFEYSPKNKSAINDSSSLILTHINNNYETYKHGTEDSIDINLPSDIFKDWIVNHYSNKNVKYVITKGNSGYIIFPLDKYDSYFNISANLRPKTCGSSVLPKCDENIIYNLVSSYYGECSIYADGKDRFCTLSKGSIPDECKLKSPENNRRYKFNKISNNSYEVRKLSNTRNANVIFSIKLISDQNIDDLELFKKEFI